MTKGGRFVAALATLIAFAAADACLGYLLWGVGLGMHDIEWLPLFPLWLVLAVTAGYWSIRLHRAYRGTVTLTAVCCALLTIPFVGAALALGAWACSDGGGCHGPLTR